MSSPSSEVAVFGGGCFWCVEAIFESLKGVISVEPGYAGGDKEDPGYEEVHTGETGHAEVVRVEFDPAVISYRDLLTVFFFSHDSTTKDRQGADVGSEYRSLVIYTSALQKEEADRFIAELKAVGTNSVTEVQAYKGFFMAEEEHKNFYQKNKSSPYCMINVVPKIKKLQDRFAALMKEAAH